MRLLAVTLAALLCGALAATVTRTSSPGAPKTLRFKSSAAFDGALTASRPPHLPLSPASPASPPSLPRVKARCMYCIVHEFHARV
jgi:hypothetical protein